MSKQFLHNSAGAIDIPVSHEKALKSSLGSWKQRHRNDISDFVSLKNRKKCIGKQPSVTFNLNDATSRRPHFPRKGALSFFLN